MTPGTTVKAGDVLAQLTNPQLDEQIDYLEYRLRAADISAAKFSALGRPAEEQAVRTQAEAIAEELATRKKQRERLTIRAEHAGRVVAAPRYVEPVTEMQGFKLLPMWQGHPLAPENQGARLDPGTPLCEIRPIREFEAVLLVEQSDMAFLTPDLPVRIKLDAFPGQTLLGTLREIGSVVVEHPPRQLLITNGGELPVRMRPDGQVGLPGAYYEVRVSLDGLEGVSADPHELLRSGFRGRARIECGQWTCWDILQREFHKLIHL